MVWPFGTCLASFAAALNAGLIPLVPFLSLPLDLAMAGKREEVADALATLAEETASKAGDERSEAYEAHAVLLNLKRKQQDSADAVIKIARDRKVTDLRDAATKMKRELKSSADALGKSLADFAVEIAAA